MQELIHELPVQPAPRRSRPKTILAVLMLLGALSAGGYFLWQELYPDSASSQLQPTILEDGTILAAAPSDIFSTSKTSNAVS